LRKLGRATRASPSAPSSDHHGGDDSSDRASDGASRGWKSRKLGERSNGRNGSRDAECDECKPDHDVPRAEIEWLLLFSLGQAGLQHIEWAGRVALSTGVTNSRRLV
jgi:hypothetical protein